MPDISMCADHECPSAKKCYRHEAKATPMWQFYGDFGRPDKAKKCKAGYWPFVGKSQKKRLDIQHDIF